MSLTGALRDHLVFGLVAGGGVGRTPWARPRIRSIDCPSSSLDFSSRAGIVHLSSWSHLPKLFRSPRALCMAVSWRMSKINAPSSGIPYLSLASKVFLGMLYLGSL